MILRKKEEDLPALVKIQRAILKNAVEYAVDGGFVIYSTCSILKEENEDVLEVLPSFAKVESTERYFPGEAEGIDGFFIAKIKIDKGTIIPENPQEATAE
jgi:16S rRNA (cytosine967-C5)-methyltransferase